MCIVFLIFLLEFLIDIVKFMLEKGLGEIRDG